MPYINLQTNIEVTPEAQPALLSALSTTASKLLGKSENYVMVALEAGTPMLFGGSDAPCAYLIMKSLGLPEDKTGDYSAALCELVAGQLEIPADRVFIEFASPDRHLWGWNGKTF